MVRYLLLRTSEVLACRGLDEWSDKKLAFMSCKFEIELDGVDASRVSHVVATHDEK